MKRELEQLQNRLKVRECFNKCMKPLKKLVYDESAATCSWCLCLFVQEETLRVQAETKLDINLESSRISDMVRQIHRHVWCAPQSDPVIVVCKQEVLTDNSANFNKDNLSECEHIWAKKGKIWFCVFLSVYWAGEEADGGQHRLPSQGNQTLILQYYYSTTT